MAEVAGINAQAVRHKAGAQLQDVARALRHYGLRWSTGHVGDFESGRVSPTLPTLFVVAAALSDVAGHPVTLVQLLGSPGPVRINDRLVVDEPALSDALLGKPVHAVKPAPFGPFNTDPLPKWARYIPPALPVRVLHDFTETDERVCKRIGVPAAVGAAAMELLWKRTFRAERDHRAGPDANAQRRGQISRQLQAELQKQGIPKVKALSVRTRVELQGDHGDRR